MLKSSIIRLSFIAALLHAPAAAHINGLTLARFETTYAGRAEAALEVKLFLIAVDDAGRSGKKIGCDELQGFAFGQPLSTADLELYLRNRSWRAVS